MAAFGFLNSFLGMFQQSGQGGTPKIEYQQNGGSGYVYYQSAESAFKLYFEFSGGNCVASINIPTTETWEKTTGLPLERREETLQFIGKQVVKDQTTDGRGYFKIEGNWLHIYA